ncbi:hypothetical protein Dcar01_02941 [Deinococcus carri]|uniref:N-acetyltransferase domain-containing protein n=1 Tax=Deinococcus carri TaxID=1211323 RepID=A0ABP9WA10_9DEIO
MRPYRQEDFEACLALFDSNTPSFFAPEERAAFERFLLKGSGRYFVLEEEGRVVACGGVALAPDAYPACSGGVPLPPDSSGLTWGMVAQNLHRRGLGTQLLQARLGWLRAHAPHVREVRLSTSQFTAPYYARQGFRPLNVTPDGFAPGIDAVEMRLEWLTPGLNGEGQSGQP